MHKFEFRQDLFEPSVDSIDNVENVKRHSLTTPQQGRLDAWFLPITLILKSGKVRLCEDARQIYHHKGRLSFIFYEGDIQSSPAS